MESSSLSKTSSSSSTVNLNKHNQNKELVEGSFKHFTFREITPADYDQVVQNLLTYFVNDEPARKALKVDEIYKEEFEASARIVLEQNMSFLAEDRETNEIAALRLNYIQRQNEDIFSSIQLKSKQSQILAQWFRELNQQTNLYQRYSVSEFGIFFAACTTSKYRQQGLVKEFYVRTLAYFRAFGLSLAEVIVSSPYTDAATTALGFKAIGRVDLKDLVNPETGEKYFTEQELNFEEVYQMSKIYQL